MSTKEDESIGGVAGFVVSTTSAVASLWLYSVIARHLFDSPTVWHMAVVGMLSMASFGQILRDETSSLTGLRKPVMRALLYWGMVGVAALLYSFGAWAFL